MEARIKQLKAGAGGHGHASRIRMKVKEDGDGLTYSAKRIGRVCLSREDWSFRELSKIKGEHLESFARTFPAKKLSSFLALKKRRTYAPRFTLEPGGNMK